MTLYDLKSPSNRLSQWRRIPEIITRSMQLVWKAGRRYFLAVIVLQFVAAAAISVQLLVGREVLQGLFQAGDTGNFGSLGPEVALLIGMTVLIGAVGALAGHQQRLLSELVACDSFERIIDVASGVELASFENPVFYDQLMRARTSGSTKPVEIVGSITLLVMSTLTTAGIGFTLFMMHPLLLLFILLAGIPVLLSTLYNSRQAYEFEYMWTPRNRERAYLLDLLTGKHSATEIRVFGATRYLRRRFDDLTEERISRLRDFLRERLRVALAGTAGGTLGIVVALGALVWLVVTGRVDVATAVTAGVAMQMINSRVASMTRGVGNLVEGGMFLDDYHAFLALGTESVARSAGREEGLPQPTIQQGFEGLAVEHVSFTYPNTDVEVLHDVSLEVRPGEIVALVGENGSGKTTLVKLICSLYRPDSGRIVWNGVDAEEIDPVSLRSDITVIFQNFLQYHLSAMENIALGRVDQEIDPAEVEATVTEAARRSGAHEFISRLPRGYLTRLGRQFYGGHELSVGQWQRLALARAFYRGGGFLVLDEPTAALDPRAEHKLFRQMHALSAGRSVLLISHRFSSVRSADRIYVLEDGRITESGTHDQLMALDGHYAELFSLQAAAYLGEAPARSGSIPGSDSSVGS